MAVHSTYEFLLSEFGPALTVDQAAGVLHRSPAGLKKSASTPGHPLANAKRQIGRRIYFAASEIAKLLDQPA